mmetsp:Transcript_55151/g.66383  ORF Transcript_55151/g.66383 Transcript_55151/m.66383 type:complete len:100 (-) Transcript_55151:229-528(-)
MLIWVRWNEVVSSDHNLCKYYSEIMQRQMRQRLTVIEDNNAMMRMTSGDGNVVTSSLSTATDAAQNEKGDNNTPHLQNDTEIKQVLQSPCKDEYVKVQQ